MLIKIHQLRTQHWLRLVAEIDTAAGSCPPRKKWAADAIEFGLEEAWRLFQENPAVASRDVFPRIEATMELIRNDHIERFPT